MADQEWMQKIWVEKNTYRDSVALMRLAAKLNQIPGVADAAVLMGTPANINRLRSSGFDAPELEVANIGDLCIGLRSEELRVLEIAETLVREFLRGSPEKILPGKRAARPRTLSSAYRQNPLANLVSISLPGEYAAREAEKALELGLHVFMFSDNVSLADEIRLKQIARDRGLLMMGPDCGTAMIGHVPLGFCNAVPQGSVGIVSASGTGAQAVMCHLAQRGVGVSHVIGTGGRDLDSKVRGISFKAGIRALADDPKTEVLLLISKPPAEEVKAEILNLIRNLHKPAVLYMLGENYSTAISHPGSLLFGSSLTHTASIAAALIRKETLPEPLSFARFCESLESQTGKFEPRAGSKYVRGLFSGGTLAQEAARILENTIGDVHIAPDTPNVAGHSLIDLGADKYTTGRPHPMIDFSLRLMHLAHAIQDPATAVILLDVVLGTNAEPDPAARLQTMLSASNTAGIPVVVYICGTQEDPQDLEKQARALRESGCFVFRSNEEAACAAAWLSGLGG